MNEQRTIEKLEARGSNHWCEFTKRQRTLNSLPQRNDIKADLDFNRGECVGIGLEDWRQSTQTAELRNYCSKQQ